MQPTHRAATLPSTHVTVLQLHTDAIESSVQPCRPLPFFVANSSQLTIRSRCSRRVPAAEGTGWCGGLGGREDEIGG